MHPAGLERTDAARGAAAASITPVVTESLTAAAADAPVADPAADFREAMARFPSGATIVTTTAADGRHWGFTASAFCSLSASPPLVLVCLATTANCYDAFMAADDFVIHFVHSTQTETALTFARRDADKFAGLDYDLTDAGVPLLADAGVALECTAEDRVPGGDHVILIGRVHRSHLAEAEPAVYFRRGFHLLP